MNPKVIIKFRSQYWIDKGAPWGKLSDAHDFKSRAIAEAVLEEWTRLRATIWFPLYVPSAVQEKDKSGKLMTKQVAILDEQGDPKRNQHGNILMETIPVMVPARHPDFEILELVDAPVGEWKLHND